MKKIFKCTLAIIIVTALCFSLSSCFIMDRIKGNVGYYENDGGTKISFADEHYIELKDFPYQYLSIYAIFDYGYVVKDKNKLILNENDDDVLPLYYNKNDLRLLIMDERFYCREDVYDYAKKTLEDNVFEYYGIERYDYENDTSTFESVDKKVLDAVDEIIHNTQPLSEEPEEENRTYEIESVVAADKEAMFMYTLFYIEKLCDGSYHITMDNLADDIYGYVASKEYAEIFDPLFPEWDETQQYEPGDEFKVEF